MDIETNLLCVLSRNNRATLRTGEYDPKVNSYVVDSNVITPSLQNLLMEKR